MKKLVFFSALLALLLMLIGCGTAEAQFPFLQETILPDQAVPLAASSTQTISREQAQEIALKHAGFTIQEVTCLRTEFDWDDNRWDVDFRAGDWEHEYDIHTGSGDIIKVDKEYDPIESSQTQLVNTTSQISAEEARAVALKHADVRADQIRFLRVAFDFEDGVPQYTVEFVTDGWEYDYEIHAETGAILSFDKDR